MSKRNLLIASTSTVFGKPYLEYLKDEVKEIFSASKEVLFIPYARPAGITYEEYTIHARKFFDANGMTLIGLQEFDNPNVGLKRCEGIFTGGGNTFVLLKSLYDQELLLNIKEKISEGIPYLGTSAGSNILGATIRTTNDMPVEYPPSFEAIGAVPFNINPHYVDPDPDSKHMGETRETRIKEFLVFNDTPVVGLREGSYLRVKGEEINLGGPHSARIFEGMKEPYELLPQDDFSFLLQ